MAEEEAPRVFEAPGGLCVSYRGRLLYSARDPGRLPRRVGAACDPGPSRLHLVPSPLLWYGLDELLSAMGPGSAILCVEADPALARLARESMPPEIDSDGRVTFAAADSVEALLDATAGKLGRFRACSVAALSGGEALNAPLYRAMAAALSVELESGWRNRAALMTLGERWARNILDNVASLPEIAPGPLPRFPGAAAVCGAGSSLEAALPFLAEERGRLAVIACDTALGTLLAAGVEPDLVVCLEAQAHNVADFIPLGRRPAPIVADLSSHPLSFRAIRGRRHLTLTRITESPFLSRISDRLRSDRVPFLDFPPLGSVGVHAARLASSLAAGPVLATGLDFCFDAGKTHARGCPALAAEERRMDRLRRWRGQLDASFRDRNLRVGKGLLSDPVLLSYAGILASGGAGGLLLDIRGRGPSIGGRPVGFAEARRAVRAASRGSPATLEIEDPAYRDRLGKAAASIIDDELSRVTRLRALTVGGASGREDARTEFRRLLGESDYLFWSFPDADRVEGLPQDFLNRLSPRIEYWKWRLGELRERLGEATRAARR